MKFSGEKIKIRVKSTKNNCGENVVSMIKKDIESIPIDSDCALEVCKTIKTNKTIKKKKELSELNKSKLWEIFDNDKKHLEKKINSDNENIECIYEKMCKEEQELCKLCNSRLMIMDDGFPTCTNIKCSVMDRDVLDY
jgi:hypothetical protein